jgi:MFS family permease
MKYVHFLSINLTNTIPQWGVIVVCTSAAKNWAGLVTTRVLLGVFESAVAPSLMLITTMWYKVRMTHLSEPQPHR